MNYYEKLKRELKENITMLKINSIMYDEPNRELNENYIDRLSSYFKAQIKEDVLEECNKLLDKFKEKHNALIKQDKTGEDYIKDMFVYELVYNNYYYTHDPTSALKELELTYEQVMENPILKHGFMLAKQEIANRELNQVRTEVAYRGAKPVRVENLKYEKDSKEGYDL